MLTVPEAAEKIIDRSRYLSEAISKDLINLSSLARYIKPELEEMLNKKVSGTAILMALNRLSNSIKPKNTFKNIFPSTPDMIVRSNLTSVVIKDSAKFAEKYPSVFKLLNANNKDFLTVTQGALDTTVIASKNLAPAIKRLLKNDDIVFGSENLSAITIRLPQEALLTPGTVYFFLKSLAWEGINIVEIVSSNLELTLIFSEKDTNRAFAILQSLFVQPV
jgi:aspartokinase